MNSVEILGVSGYWKTTDLKDHVDQALRELNIQLNIEEITDVNAMIESDITAIPALRVNGKVIAQKNVPSVEDLKILLKTILRPTEATFQLKKILVPTDFSQTASAAYTFALELAKKTNAQITLLHCFQHDIDPTFPFLSGKSQAYVEGKKDLLKEFHRYCQAESNNVGLDEIEVETELVPGFATQEIVNWSTDADLIIMGTTGAGNILDKLFGSVSSHVAQNAHCPVLLIPNGVKFEGFKDIVYASNYHQDDEIMLQQIIDFSSLFDANIHFVHVVENTSANYNMIKNNFEQIFREKAPALGFNLVKIENSSLLHAAGKYIDENDVNLMVMATTHRNFIENLLHRSKTKKMVFNTKVPLMVMHFDD